MGSGRTNVAETIFGDTPATSGEIRLDGVPVTIASPRQGMKAGMALLTEDRKDTGCFLTSGFTIIGVDAYVQGIMKGVIIVAAVVIDQYRQRRRREA